jgi:hypothetical protein
MLRNINIKHGDTQMRLRSSLVQWSAAAARSHSDDHRDRQPFARRSNAAAARKRLQPSQSGLHRHTSVRGGNAGTAVKRKIRVTTAQRGAAVPAQLAKMVNLLATGICFFHREAAKFGGGSRRLGRRNQRGPLLLVANSSNGYASGRTAGAISARTPRKSAKKAEALQPGPRSAIEHRIPVPTKRPQRVAARTARPAPMHIPRYIIHIVTLRRPRSGMERWSAAARSLLDAHRELIAQRTIGTAARK